MRLQDVDIVPDSIVKIFHGENYMDDKLRFRKGTWKKRTLKHIQSFVLDPLPDEEVALWASRIADGRRLGALGERIYDSILKETGRSMAVESDMIMVLNCLAAMHVMQTKNRAGLFPYVPKNSNVWHSLSYAEYWTKATVKQFKELTALIQKVSYVEMDTDTLTD